MNGLPVVGHEVAGLKKHRFYQSLIGWAVVDNGLGETQNCRRAVWPNAADMRTANVTQTTVLFIHRIEGQPESEDVRWFQAEIKIVLMRRSRVFRAGRFVEPFRFLSIHLFPNQGRSELCPSCASWIRLKKRIDAHVLHLLESLQPSGVLIEGRRVRKGGHDLANVPVEVRGQFPKFVIRCKLTDDDEAIPVKSRFQILRIHS